MEQAAPFWLGSGAQAPLWQDSQEGQLQLIVPPQPSEMLVPQTPPAQVSGVQPQTLGVPPPPQVCGGVQQVAVVPLPQGLLQQLPFMQTWPA